MTCKVGDSATQDFDFLRLPVAIPNKQAVTMWPALCAGLGGLWPGLSRLPARYRAVLVTCDAARANLKLLGHLHSVLDPHTMLLPFLCLQHRTGNVIERVTKLLSVLTGCYAVAKTLRLGFIVRKLKQHVTDILKERLQILDEVPPGLEEEWATGRVSAKQILALAKTGDDGEAAGRRSGHMVLELFSARDELLGARMPVPEPEEVRKHGLHTAFSPSDSRAQSVRGLWPGSALLRSDEVLKGAMEELSKYLVADTYGGVDAVRWAREAYNSRL
eukprot:Skav225675  [mRNA]  locus=scaffold1924:366724:368019:- [translate_table: standard]